MGIHKIILSCNEDPVYSEFWVPVASAYKKIFPDVKIHLAFLTWRDESDPLVELYRQYGEVTLFLPVSDVPEFAQAKMVRFILASQQGEDVCYIDDIDLFPLSKEFITDKTDKRPPRQLLCVGGEVYDNNGCYPVSQMTAEGFIWKHFINPVDKSYRELMDEWKQPTMFDRREDVCIKLDWAKDDYFSDERLLRRLIHLNPVPKFELPRGYDNYLDATIDRHTWNKHKQEWEFDRNKLASNGYVNAHGIRPFKKNEKHYEPLILYIDKKYE